MVKNDKKLDKALDKAVNELFKDYKKAIKKAAEEVTEKAKNDIYTKSISCLVDYYEDYDPTSYNRTYNLINCFVPYANPVVELENSYECIAGIEYDPKLIENDYYGSDIYSPADAEWIIDNYLAGIHPRTNGSTAPGDGNYEYEKYYGNVVPSYEMQKFIDSYWFTFDKNLRFSLSKQVLKLTKKAR